MRDPAQLEDQLRSWTPRQPAPKLNRRLFGTAEAETPAPSHGLFWHWWAPATAALVLSLALFSQQHPLTVLTGPSTGLVTTAMIMMPQSSPAVYLASHHSDNNTWPQASFEWTNRSHSLTTAPPFAGTNSLLQ